MVSQARRETPLESCGILAGTDGRVEAVHEMTNADASAEHFNLIPREQFDVVRRMRADGHEMLAIYHSHPASPAWPSEEDIRLALTPDVAYVIVSLAEPNGPVVRGFHINDGTVTQVELDLLAP